MIPFSLKKKKDIFLKVPYTGINNKTHHDHKCYGFECLLGAKYCFKSFGSERWGRLAKVTQLISGERRIEMQAVQLLSLRSLTLSSFPEHVFHGWEVCTRSWQHGTQLAGGPGTSSQGL